MTPINPVPTHADCAQSPDAHQEATYGRRAFLRRSLGAMIGLSLGAPLIALLGGEGGVSAVLAEPSANDPVGAKRLASVKSVIVLWMDGGPPQTDTWDPKPGHRNGGQFKAIRTASGDLMLSEHMPQIAAVADRLAVVRSMSTGEGNHERARHLMRTGYKPTATVKYPGLGAIVSAELGSTDYPIPQNVCIGAPGQPGGILGVSYDPFFVKEAGKPVQDLAPPAYLTSERVDRRLSFLAEQEAGFRTRLGGESHDVSNHEQLTAAAVRFMRAGQSRAFDISGESEAVRNAYGDSAFGRGCLMARRLVEAGVKFVEVTLPGWDTHDDNFTRVKALLQSMDPAMSSLLRDLESKHLLDSTLVVWMGEFGRTPRINGRDGRDHFPGGWSAVLAGGGVRGGTVVGATSDDGLSLRGQPIAAPDLYRTICTAAGIDAEKQIISPQGRPIKYVTGGRVIAEVLRG